jgi:mannose-6-phosphate isomerase-like protein (cupin superfamily)
MKSVKTLMLAAAAAGALGLIAQAVAQNAPAPAGAPAAGAPAAGAAPGRGRGGRGAAPIVAWIPKTTRLTPYEAPNRPVWRLSEIKKMHPGNGSWEQPIVRNKEMWADYIQLAAGTRTPTVMWPDNRIGMIVWEGQIRVSVDGHEPFVASKGFQINIPFRTPYTLEVVGNEPGLYFMVREADHFPLYPVAGNPAKPRDIPGYTYVQATTTPSRGTIDSNGAYGPRLYLDYYKEVVNNPQGRGGAFIASDHFFMNNIRGMGVPTPPPTNIGHFHAEYTEFWFIIEGKMEHLIEGIPEVVQSEAGDVVTAAQGRYHRASFAAGQMDTRVAINPFPQGLHNSQPPSAGGRGQ